MEYWQDKVVVVTGASAGLGKCLAEEAAAAGAKLVLAARGAEALQRTAASIRSAGREVLAVPTDVTDQGQVDHLFKSTIDRFGRIDALMNNAGRSMRRAAIETTAEDFQDLMELNLISVVRCTRAAVEHLLNTRGHLVNIGSLAGKAAGRWMGAYSATKFALSSYTQQLRLELGPQGLHVMLVCPGPIQRDTPRENSHNDLDSLPESAGKPGAGVKARAIDPRLLARRILSACRRRRGELIYPSRARIVFALSQLSPRLADLLVKWTT
jgi:short-subunit dehydrogenase